MIRTYVSTVIIFSIIIYVLFLLMEGCDEKFKELYSKYKFPTRISGIVLTSMVPVLRLILVICGIMNILYNSRRDGDENKNNKD